MENIDYVKEKWKTLTSFSKKEDLKEQMWEEIVYRYAEQHRHYHNLNHIAYLLTLLDKSVGKLTNPAAVGFAVLYHDVVYDTYSSDNEEQSAAFAEAQMRQLNISNTFIEKVKTLIAATKDHKIQGSNGMENDLSYFLDFDMAILGADEDMYKLYSQKIRKEYSKYNDKVYREGRKLALQNILSSENIFFTPEFRQEMEQKARENINREVSLL
jgi:predicted metal-dependent HD superfamily phosphohydrolase